MKNISLLVLGLLASVWQTGALPLSRELEAMTPEEKASAIISVDIDRATVEQEEEAQAIAGLWNTGDHGAALGRLSALEGQVDPDDMELSINWKTPVPSLAPEWGDDVQIGYRDSIFSVSLSRHPASGNLFAVLSWCFGSDRGASANFSDDGGQTWSEVFGGLSSSPNYKSTGVVLGDYYYFAYIFNNSIRLRRRYASTGQEAPFRDGSYYKSIYTATTDTIDEVSLADWSTSQLFCGTIHQEGRLNMFWTGDTGGVDWQQFNSPESTARMGLDMHGNYPYSLYYLFVSYFTKTNQMRTLGLGPGLNWDTLINYGVAPNRYFTAVGAYRDTVLVAYEDTADGDLNRIRYRASYNGGSSYSFGSISSADTNGYCPDVAMRGGWGTGVAYFQEQPTQCRFRWRTYIGSWATYTGISDVTPSTFYRPSVEYLGGGHYGIAYLSTNADLSRAYFDRSDWTGVAGGPSIPLGDLVGLRLLPNAPNPFDRITTIRYQITRPSKVSLKVYNAAGQCLKTLVNEDKKTGSYEVVWDGRDGQGKQVANGVYLYRLVTADGPVARKMILVK